MTQKRYPLPKRFNVALSEKAYNRLRVLNAKYGYGNNYLLTILLENLDDISNESSLDSMFAAFKEQFGAPPPSDTPK
ncbi:hypothetical protein [Kaarinaea lacus]